jgi:hypothetical protein
MYPAPVIDANETDRRLKILGDRYRSIGVYDDGRRHDIDFTGESARLLLAG